MKSMANNKLSLISSAYSQYRILDNMIYILADGYNGLFRASVEDGQIELVKKFVHQYNYEVYPLRLVKKEMQLFFLPARAKEIAVYDLEYNELCEIPLEWETSGDWITREFFFENENLWIFPMQDALLFKFDLKEKKVVSSINIREIYIQYIGTDYDFFSAYGCYLCEDRAFLACYEQPYLFVFHLKANEVEFIPIHEVQEGFTALIGEGNKLYVLNKDGRLMIWNIEKGEPEIFINIGEKVREFDSKYYINMSIVGRKLFICGSDITKALNISLTEDYQISMFDETIVDELERACFNKTLQFKYYEGNDLYGCGDEEQYFCIDLLANKLKWIREIVYDPHLLKKSIRDTSTLLKKQQVIPENAVAFEDYIKGNFEEVVPEEASDVGHCIHKSITKDY